MKRILLLLSVLLVLALAACGGGSKEGTTEDQNKNEGKTDGKEEVVIKVGASSVPHAELLEEAQPILAEKGITLEIEQYEDYVLPNEDLENGTLDANFFQHIPYLEQTVKDTGYDLTYIGSIHIEPMGAYSKNIKSIDEIKDGTEVILSNSVADHGRVLSLFQDAGLIKISDDVEIVDDARIEDIVENPKNLTFTPDYEPAFLPELYGTEEDTIAVINTNYAMQAGLNPQEDSLFIEEDNSPYVNVVAVRAEDKDNEALQTLVDVLHSDEIKDFIIEKYDGAVVPVSE